ncbi:hypothetical protein [Labilibaculum filiforme]|nr:hypothetical protein [Labilibaculum filiforme]
MLNEKKLGKKTYKHQLRMGIVPKAGKLTSSLKCVVACETLSSD